MAECPEGYGNTTFEQWMIQADTPEQVLERISRKFILGGHKAAAVASVLLRAEVYLVSEMGAPASGHLWNCRFRNSRRGPEGRPEEGRPRSGSRRNSTREFDFSDTRRTD